MHPDIGTHPVKVRITTDCQTLVDQFLTDDSTDARAFEIPPGQSRVVFDTEVSRTWRPSDSGNADTRELGLAVEADLRRNAHGRLVAGALDPAETLRPFLT